MSRLVRPEELATRLGSPGLAVVEVAFHPDDGPFREAHVPGSRWAHWKRLLWHDTERRFPEPGTMAARLGALGIGDDDELVLVGDPIQFAAYGHWVLRMLGRESRILDGGRARWAAGGFPVEAGMPVHEPKEHAPFPREPDFTPLVGRDDVLAALGGDTLIIDFRSPEEYRGERVAPTTAPMDHGAERHGRIPGARSLHVDRLLGEDGTLLDPEALREVFRREGLENGADVIAYCRLSHRASLGWFVLRELLGHDRVRVYDGSWTEWGSMVGMPVEREPAG